MTFAYFGEEFVVEDLIQCESVAGVFLQDAWDEFLCSGGKRGWQVVPNFLYTLVCFLQVKSLKRRVSTHQRVPEWDQTRSPLVNSRYKIMIRMLWLTTSSVWHDWDVAKIKPKTCSSKIQKCYFTWLITHMTHPRDQTSDSVPWPCLLSTSGAR